MVDIGTRIRVSDTETTAKDWPYEMVEFGWTDLILTEEGWQVEGGPWAVLVNPGRPISFGAMAVHHITPMMVAKGRGPDELRSKMMDRAHYVAAHKYDYDAKVIQTDLPSICTYKCSLVVWPDLESHSNGAIRYAKNLCPFDERCLPSHRAGPDTWVTAHILLELLKEKPIEELVSISTKPPLLATCWLKQHRGKPWSEVPDEYLDWIVNKSNMPNEEDKADVVHTAMTHIRRRAAAARARPSEGQPEAAPPQSKTDAMVDEKRKERLI